MPLGAKTFSEALQIGAECFHNLKKVFILDFPLLTGVYG